MLWLSFGLVAVYCAVWVAGKESETIRRAGGLRVGMSVEEVDAIMGAPWISSRLPDGELRTIYATTSERVDIGCRWCLWALLTKIGLPADRSFKGWPITVDFDEQQQARRIMRRKETFGPRTIFDESPY